MVKKKLAVVGCGFLGNIIVDACVSGLLEDYELVGVLSRTGEKARAAAEKGNCRACSTLEELLALSPDYVAEAASVQTVKEIAVPVLSSGAHLILLSIGALADEGFYDRVLDAARSHGSQVHIASGAVGGFDVLRTVTLMAQAGQLPQTAGIVTHKGPASLQNTPLFTPGLMEDHEPSQVLSGTAAQAISLLPTKVNVMVAAALATTGPKNASAEIVSTPGFAGDDHRITTEIDGVKAVVDIYSRTSAIAGWSVVALLQNLASPIMF